MGKALVVAGLTAWLVAVAPVTGYGQQGDIRALEQAYYDRLVTLNAQIAEGWTPAQVVAVMGPPDRLREYVDGADAVEVWGYRGFEVAIEFRNGLVSNWFIRFMTVR